MLEMVLGLPGQMAEAARIARRAKLGPRARFENVVVAGMGGSGIGGKLASSLLLNESPVPVLLYQDYDLPAAVTERTLLFVVSYSGNTEETLSAFRQAQKRRCKVVVITSGGKLGVAAGRAGCPVITVPGGMPPRAALGYLFVPLLASLERLGVCPSHGRGMAEALRLTRAKRAVWHRRARTIARRLAGRLPVVYSTSRLLDAVADRWRCQLNENAGVMCHTNVLPEQNHNEIVGMGRPEFLARRSVVLALLDKETNPRNRLRLDAVLKIAGSSYQSAMRVESEGRSMLARVLSLVMLGDLVSVELALLLKKDPMEIKRIDALKRVMSGAGA